VVGVERVRHAQDGPQLVDQHPRVGVEGHVGQVRLVGRGAPVVAGDVGDDRHVVAAQAEDLRHGEDVLRVLVVAAEVHEDSNVVEESPHLQEQAVPGPEAVLGAQGVEEPRGERGHVCRVASVVAVLLPERGGGGQHLAGEVLDPVSLVGPDHVEEEPGTQRRIGDEHLFGLGLEEQLPVDEERRHEGLDLGEGQAVGLHQLLVVEGHRLLAEGEEALAREVPRAEAGVVPHDLIGDEARVPAEGEEVLRLPQRHLAADVLDDVLHGALKEPHPLVVAAVPRGEVLAHADRAEGVGAGVDGLAPAQEREVGAAPSHLDEEGVPAREGLVLLESLAHRDVGEAVLLGAVDRLDVDARAQAHAVEEGVAVDRLAHRARRHRAVADDAVGVHDPAEALQGPQGRLDGGRPQAAAGEGVPAQEDGARGLLEDPGRLAGGQLGHDQPDGARPHVQDGHRPEGRAAGRRGRSIGRGCHRNVSGRAHHCSSRVAKPAQGADGSRLFAPGDDAVTPSPAPDDRASLLLEDRVKRVFRELPGAVAGQEEPVHQVRVAGRRLRVALPLLARKGGSRPVTRAVKVLRHLTRAVGQGRDMDVILGLFEDRVATARSASAEQRALLSRLRAARARSRSQVAEDVLDLDIDGLRRDLRLLLGRGAATSATILARVRALREEEGKEVLRGFSRVGDRYRPEELHALRRRIRRLRYAAEVEDSVLGEESRAPVLLKRLQDGIGVVHDHHVLAGWFEEQARLAEGRNNALLARAARRERRALIGLGRLLHRALLETKPSDLALRALQAMARGRSISA
jgi:CHAD domain-containing protein